MSSLGFDSLCRYLDGLRGRAPLEELLAELARHELSCEDVPNHPDFSSRHYARNLVRASDWYYLLVLCWRNGQRSPIHDHAGSTCGVRVLRGTLTETRFTFAPNGMVVATGSQEHAPGSIIGSEDQDLHQVSNV